jgi:hypothetical protein
MSPTDSIGLRLSSENSERQLRMRMKNWKIRKRLNSSEMSFIVACAKQRADLGQETAFLVRGSEVSREKINRFTKENVLQELEAIYPRACMFNDVGETQSR